MAGFARADLNGDGDGRHATVPADQKIKRRTTKLRSRLRTAFSARVSGSSGETGSSHIDSAGRGSVPKIGSRNNIPTCRLKGRLGRGGLRDIHIGAGRGRDGRELSVRAQLDGLRWGGVRVAERAGFSMTKRGTRYLIGKVTAEKKLLLPAAVVPPRIHLYRQPRIQNEPSARVRVRVRNR